MWCFICSKEGPCYHSDLERARQEAYAARQTLPPFSPEYWASLAEEAAKARAIAQAWNQRRAADEAYFDAVRYAAQEARVRAGIGAPALAPAPSRNVTSDPAKRSAPATPAPAPAPHTKLPKPPEPDYTKPEECPEWQPFWARRDARKRWRKMQQLSRRSNITCIERDRQSELIAHATFFCNRLVDRCFPEVEFSALKQIPGYVPQKGFSKQWNELFE